MILNKLTIYLLNNLAKAKREIAILMNSYALIYEKFNENSKGLVCA